MGWIQHFAHFCKYEYVFSAASLQRLGSGLILFTARMFLACARAKLAGCWLALPVASPNM